MYSNVLLVSDFDYQLPLELIAQEPLPDRAASRMMVLRRDQQSIQHAQFRDLPNFLRTGDCVVLNNSRVLPSRLFGTRENGPARLQVFLVEQLSEQDRTWRALVRPGRKVRKGDRIRFSDHLAAEVIDWGERGERTIRFLGSADVLGEVERIGHVPLPPYIHRPDQSEDRERYQTVYATRKGSVAAPTAGLHFTGEVLDACRNAGANVAEVTLHVGLGTFAPLAADVVEKNQLHRERYTVTDSALRAIREAERRIAVGTTSVRVLESVFRSGAPEGETDIFLYPGQKIAAVDAMVTNFHLPRSSLLLLVCAFAGTEFVLRAYSEAVQYGYRFFSYGDCMLIL